MMTYRRISKRFRLIEESDFFGRTPSAEADLFFNKGLSLDAELETHEKCILLSALKAGQWRSEASGGNFGDQL